MTNLSKNLPPQDMTLADAEDRIAALLDKLSYVEHELKSNPKYLLPGKVDQYKRERYEINQQIAQLQDWIDRGLI